MEITAEGDPIVIAEKRTFAHADRKIVRGSTPTEEDISLIQRAYAESDQRIFEICCPHCAEWFELLWEMIQWPDGEPEKATAFCPRCGAEIEEKVKPELVERGRWPLLRPEDHQPSRLPAQRADLAFAQRRMGQARGRVGGQTRRACRATGLRQPDPRQTMENLAQPAFRRGPGGPGRADGASSGSRRRSRCLRVGADVQDDRIEIP